MNSRLKARMWVGIVGCITVLGVSVVTGSAGALFGLVFVMLMMEIV